MEFKNIKTIYNPFNIKKNLKLSKEKIENKDKKYFNKKYFTFLNIGRLCKQKGQEFLIRNFKKVVKKYSNIRLIILGNGILKNKLRNLIKELELKKNVFLLGVKKNVFPYIKKSDCLISTSLWEGLPTVLIENLNLSNPIISTDCKSGVRELLTPNLSFNKNISYPYFGKYGILIPNFENEIFFKIWKGNSILEKGEHLRNIIIKFIEDKNIKKKYLNGFEKAKEYNIKKIIKKWNSLLI